MVKGTVDLLNLMTASCDLTRFAAGVDVSAVTRGMVVAVSVAVADAVAQHFLHTVIAIVIAKIKSNGDCWCNEKPMVKLG